MKCECGSGMLEDVDMETEEMVGHCLGCGAVRPIVSIRHVSIGRCPSPLGQRLPSHPF